jgi:predicted CxxxxCH...CXXCH cytochrome family protein
VKADKGFFVGLVCFFILFLSGTKGYSFTITTNAGPGGSITPSGPVTVKAGAAQTFTITPDLGYEIIDVATDSVSVGAVPFYTFTNVTADNSITAFFSVCSNAYPVMLESDGQFYNSIMAAYDAAASDDIIMLRAGVLPAEDLYFDAGIPIALKGGYGCSFFDDYMFTILPGSLTIAADTVVGTISVSNLGIRSTTPLTEVCDGLDNNGNGQIDEGLSFDLDNDGYTSIGSCGGSADDCDDGNHNIHPGAVEFLGDEIDQNCNGADLFFPSVEEKCFECHDGGDVNNWWHTSVETPDGTCVGCHEPQVNKVLQGHYGMTVKTAGNNMSAGSIIGCTSCHDQNHETYSGGANIVWPKVVATWDPQTLTYVNLTCDTCHENRAAAHAGHHLGADNDVRYNEAVDTSQSSRLGCAVCHHDYDSVNSTSLGLSTWETILVEHDLDGTKDGSINTCDNCHAYDGAGSPPLAEVQNAITSGNPATCATCHTDKVPDVDHGVPSSGKHAAHLVLPGVSCSTCHGNIPYFKSGTDGNGDGLIDLSETDVCDACHQDAAGNPVSGFKTGWTDPDFTLDCSSCHAVTPITGSHPAHLAMTGCGSCHDGTVAGTTAPAQHTDQNIDVYDITPADLGYPVDKTIGSAYATCSITYCHSTAQGVTDPTDQPVYATTPVWGEQFPDTVTKCRSCHNSGGHLGGFGTPMATGSHSKHLTYKFDQSATCQACHYNADYTGCTYCHDRRGANHPDGHIDVAFNPDFPVTATGSSGTYSGDSVPRTDYGGCGSLYCHSPGTKASAPYDAPNVTTLAWGGAAMPADCTGCHNGDSASTQPMATGSHGPHIRVYDCVKCHANTVENSRTLNPTLYAPKNYTYGQRYHVDGWVTVAFTSDIATNGAYAGTASPTIYRAPGSSAGSCANTYCHSDGSSVSTAIIPDNITPDWGTGALSCDGCHSYPPAYDSGNPKANSHAAHSGFTCDTCHFSTTTTGDTITNPANHANQIYDVQAGGGVTFEYNSGTCSNISCHDGSSAYWGAAADHSAIITTVDTTGCAACHSDPPPLVNGADSKVHNSCTSCHDVNGDLISLAAGQTAPGNCNSCHGRDVSNDHADHLATPGSGNVIVWEAGAHYGNTANRIVNVHCETCHNTQLGPAHDNNCDSCHPTPFDTVGTWSGGCQQGGCHPTVHVDASDSHDSTLVNEDSQYCNPCHGGEWSVTETDCANCHLTFSPNNEYQGTPVTTVVDLQESYLGAAEIHFSISENGKVAIGTTYYRLDGGPVQTGSIISSIGSHSLEYWSVDQAGNVESSTHTTPTFTIMPDTEPPVSTSNAQSSYERPNGNPVIITLAATDNCDVAPKTYYTLNDGPVQPGPSVSVPVQPGINNFTLRFWAEDWSGNIEEQDHPVNFSVASGKGTLRLIWNPGGLNGNLCTEEAPLAYAEWYIWHNGSTISSGQEGCYNSNWSGVNDIVVPLSTQPYRAGVDWWESYPDPEIYGAYEIIDNLMVTTPGQVVEVLY